MPATLHGLLERSAARAPSSAAVIDGARTITYGELDRRANQMAWTLQGLGVERGDRVGILVEKSIEAVVAIYGTLKTGAVYVPLDVGAPAARLGKIVRDSGMCVLASASPAAPSWAAVIDGSRVDAIVCLDAPVAPAASVSSDVAMRGPADLDASSTDAPHVFGISLDLAYVLYTSGSTGDPKGVKLSHENGLAFVRWAARSMALTAEDRLSSHAPFHFDLSIFDLFAAALVGAAVVLVPKQASLFPLELVKVIDAQRITIWYSVPSVLTVLATRGGLAPGSLPTLRSVIFAGEVFPTKYLRLLMEQLPSARFSNWYGPTETNVCTYYDVPPLAADQTDTIPIGRPIAGVEAIVVADDGSRAEVGEVGQLLVRGPTVMHGYWGDEERTARSLVPHPFDAELTDRLYRTGDLVEWLPSGDLRFLGRGDDQVKSRGYRIELGEIETALHAHVEVVECAVVALPDEVFGARLEAVVVTRVAIDANQLAEHCGARLPRYMVPEAFHLRADLPKTSTGKIDRQRLATELGA